MKFKKSQRGPIQPVKDNRCIACNGSGFYDNTASRTGKAIRCSSCNGTGTEPVDVSCAVCGGYYYPDDPETGDNEDLCPECENNLPYRI